METLELIKDLLSIIAPIGIAIAFVVTLKTDLKNLKGWMGSISTTVNKTSDMVTNIRVELGAMEQRLKNVEEDLRRAK